MKLFRRKNKKKETVEQKLKKSFINYFSDLFIVAMVLFWIVDNVYQSIIATIVTMSSVFISMQSGTVMFDTSMWSSIGTNVALPLSCGGAIWMIKNSVQHAIAYSKGKRANQDFPKVDGADTYELYPEEPVEIKEENNQGGNEV